MIVITVVITLLSESMQSRTKAHVELIPSFLNNIVFVHTKIYYSKVHPAEEHFLESLVDRKRILHDLMGHNSSPHLLIDNNVNSTTPIRDCITHNRLQELLSMARLNQPVHFSSMMMSKTRQRWMVNELLKVQLTKAIASREQELFPQDEMRDDELSKIIQIDVRIGEVAQDIVNIAHDLNFRERDNLVLLSERLDQAWSNLYSDPRTIMIYPGQVLADTPGFIGHVLDHVETHTHNIKVIKQAGGVGDLSDVTRIRIGLFSAWPPHHSFASFCRLLSTLMIEGLGSVSQIQDFFFLEEGHPRKIDLSFKRAEAKVERNRTLVQQVAAMRREREEASS